MAGGYPVPPLPGQRVCPSSPRSAPASRRASTRGGRPVPELPRPRHGVRRHLPDDVQEGRPPSSTPRRRRPTAPRFHGRHVLNRHPDGLEKCIGCELCAWACPADAIYVEGADNTDERALLAGRALRPRLPDQLPALHLLRPVHRGLPDPRADDEQRVRAGRQQPRRRSSSRSRTCSAPLLPGMVAPPHPMVPGTDETGLLPRQGHPRDAGAGRVRRGPAGPGR